jgi:adhesin HecA-like repeat protein
MNWERRNKRIELPLKEYLAALIDEELAKGYKLKVSIGTDSQRAGRGYKFATVILIARSRDLGGGVIKGEGGMLISATSIDNTAPKGKEGVNQRMLTEVGKSIETAYEIADLLDSYGIKIEIHADINPDPRWESNKALSAAIGYILGMGYEFKIKPDAWASSFGADRFAK